jgi:uncharacterized iron-regulated membrane protein
MRFHTLNRKVHYWASFAIALPLLVIIASGLLLQTKKHWTFVQPAELRGSGGEPRIGFPELLAAVQAVPALGVRGWSDVHRVDVRPADGLAKVALRNRWEVQVDLGTGAVLQSAYRRSDLIESIHDGSFLAGDWTKLGLFLPVGIVLLLLLFSGLWMWEHPFAARRRHAAWRAVREQERLPPAVS